MPILFAAGSMAQSAGAADLPWCGAPHLDLGDGFHATLYMFAGSPEFTLTYDVPRDAIALNGVTLGSASPQIIIFAIDEPVTQYQRLHISDQILLRNEAGGWLTSSIPHAECGNGLTLDTPELVPPPAQVQACFEAMQETGGFRMTQGRRDGGPPYMVLSVRWPLRAAVTTVRATWRAEIERERLGQCRFMPPPPPP